MTEDLRVADILRQSLRDAPPATRRRLILIAMLWVATCALQLWDIRDRHGPAGWAELTSVVLLTSGALLVALMHVLGATADDRQDDAPVIRQILLASPTVCF